MRENFHKVIEFFSFIASHLCSFFAAPQSPVKDAKSPKSAGSPVIFFSYLGKTQGNTGFFGQK
jgi:hypothetical protein